MIIKLEQPGCITLRLFFLIANLIMIARDGVTSLNCFVRIICEQGTRVQMHSQRLITLVFSMGIESEICLLRHHFCDGHKYL